VLSIIIWPSINRWRISSVSILTRPTLWLLWVLCGLLEIRTKKNKKNLNDSQESITTVCIGSAAGKEGPCIFLAKGKSSKTHPSLKPNCFARCHNLPPGSHIIITPSAYTTDEAWIEIAEKVATGIQCMPEIGDHEDWWCLLSVNGLEVI
jgi:hypothetical protein